MNLPAAAAEKQGPARSRRRAADCMSRRARPAPASSAEVLLFSFEIRHQHLSRDPDSRSLRQPDLPQPAGLQRTFRRLRESMACKLTQDRRGRSCSTASRPAEGAVDQPGRCNRNGQNCASNACCRMREMGALDDKQYEAALKQAGNHQARCQRIFPVPASNTSPKWRGRSPPNATRTTSHNTQPARLYDHQRPTNGAAYANLRRSVFDYDRRHGYRSARSYVDL